MPFPLAALATLAASAPPPQQNMRTTGSAYYNPAYTPTGQSPGGGTAFASTGSLFRGYLPTQFQQPGLGLKVGGKAGGIFSAFTPAPGLFAIPGLSLLGGGGGGAGGLFGGAGRGDTRRAAVRENVSGSPLDRIRQRVEYGEDVRVVLANLAYEDPEAAGAMRDLLLKMQNEYPPGSDWSTAILTSDKQGRRALRDAYKYATTGETVDPHRYLPPPAEAASLLIAGVPPMNSRPTPPGEYNALPVGSPQILAGARPIASTWVARPRTIFG